MKDRELRDLLWMQATVLRWRADAARANRLLADLLEAQRLARAERALTDKRATIGIDN